MFPCSLKPLGGPHESSRLTTFGTPWGRFRWIRMPFGIAPAPKEFQRRLNEAIKGSLAASFLLFVPICPLFQILASKEFLLTLNAWCMLPDFRRPLYILTFLSFVEHYSTQPKINIERTTRFVWSLALHYQQTL